MKIYTKTGDDGTTGLFSAGRIKKNAPRIRAYGEVDELNSVIGFVSAENNSVLFGDTIEWLQRTLFILGSDLATPLSANVTYEVPRINESDVTRLEKLIDTYESELQPLKNFILPGGSDLASRLHIARTIARRAEREIVTLSESEEIGGVVLPFINRFSDLLFVMARYANNKLAVTEPMWDGKR
ncbi:MAG TPA: cob(I)yrinic acid a,c-diamide adenosyltransferase [Candidatus Kapabacteria bacterium]|nr:cob(I)yrinic acid a,c-diamide adenosyltransferase [Candidatus Kapabacteria bacterium]